MFTLNTLAIYLIVWWIVLFIFLPLGVKRDNEVVSGNDPGAPKETNLKKKILLTSIVSLFVTIVVVLIKNEIF